MRLLSLNIPQMCLSLNILKMITWNRLWSGSCCKALSLLRNLDYWAQSRLFQCLRGKTCCGFLSTLHVNASLWDCWAACGGCGVSKSCRICSMHTVTGIVTVACYFYGWILQEVVENFANFLILPIDSLHTSLYTANLLFSLFQCLM